MKKLIFLNLVLVVCFVFKSNAQNVGYSYLQENCPTGTFAEEDFIHAVFPPGHYIINQNISVLIHSSVSGSMNYFYENNGSGLCYVDYDTHGTEYWDEWEIFWSVVYDDNTYDSGYLDCKQEN